MTVTENQFDVIAIIGSAGGIKALREIVSALPDDLSASVVIVQHLPRVEPTFLAELLSSRTALPVRWAKRGVKLQRGTIHVAPPNSQVVVDSDRRLKVQRCGFSPLGTPPADPLLESIAIQFGSRAIAVVLTGLLWDGATGIQAIKRCGGTVLIQDPDTALADGMPKAAIQTSGLHFVLPLNRISGALSALIAVPQVAQLMTVRHLPFRHWLRYRDNADLTPETSFSSPS